MPHVPLTCALAKEAAPAFPHNAVKDEPAALMAQTGAHRLMAVCVHRLQEYRAPCMPCFWHAHPIRASAARANLHPACGIPARACPGPAQGPSPPHRSSGAMRERRPSRINPAAASTSPSSCRSSIRANLVSTLPRIIDTGHFGIQPLQLCRAAQASGGDDTRASMKRLLVDSLTKHQRVAGILSFPGIPQSTVPAAVRQACPSCCGQPDRLHHSAGIPRSL